MEKALCESERKRKMARWKKSDPEYLHHKLLYYRKRLESIDNYLTSCGREHKFLTELKKKYAGNEI